MPDLNSPKLFKKYSKVLTNLEISGIETIIGDFCPTEVYEKLPIEGIHIIYFPTWLDIWKGNRENLLADFSTDSPYGIATPENLIDTFVEQFLAAFELKPKYMVFHISHVRPRDIFTMEYSYSDEEILKASSDLLNRVFENEKITSIIKKDMRENRDSLPYLLFENLPWPGLRFTGSLEENNFLGSVNYPKKGFMMDLSHFICLKRDIFNFSQGADFIKKSLENLDNIRENIIGIHLNGSISGEYLSQDFSSSIALWENSAPLKKYKIEISHIKSIDTHSVFESDKLQEIIALIQPKFLVYELGYKNFQELIAKVKLQNSFLNNL